MQHTTRNSHSACSATQHPLRLPCSGKVSPKTGWGRRHPGQGGVLKKGARNKSLWYPDFHHCIINSQCYSSWWRLWHENLQHPPKKTHKKTQQKQRKNQTNKHNPQNLTSSFCFIKTVFCSKHWKLFGSFFAPYSFPWLVYRNKETHTWILREQQWLPVIQWQRSGHPRCQGAMGEAGSSEVK